MKKEQPLVDKEYVLEKFPAKGGWTFARIPEIPKSKAAFGLIRVRGTIDSFSFTAAHLMPDGKGGLFLPVKAAIRKQIKKKDGDKVRIVLYEDNMPLELPEEFAICLTDEPDAHAAFRAMSNGEQKAMIEFIFSAKNESTRIDRMAKAINGLVNKL